MYWYTGRIQLTDGTRALRRLMADTLADAVDLFRSQLAYGEILIQVKGNAVNMRYTEVSEVFLAITPQ